MCSEASLMTRMGESLCVVGAYSSGEGREVDHKTAWGACTKEANGICIEASLMTQRDGNLLACKGAAT